MADPATISNSSRGIQIPAAPTTLSPVTVTASPDQMLGIQGFPAVSPLPAAGAYSRTLCDLGFCQEPTMQVGTYFSDGSRSGMVRQMPVGTSQFDALMAHRVARENGFNDAVAQNNAGRAWAFSNVQSTPAWEEQFRAGITAGLNPTAAAANANMRVVGANPGLGAGYTVRQAAADEGTAADAQNRTAAVASALNMPELADLGYTGGLGNLSQTGVHGVINAGGVPRFIVGSQDAPVAVGGLPADQMLALPSAAQKLGVSGMQTAADNRAETLFRALYGQQVRQQAAAATAQDRANKAADDEIKRLEKALTEGGGTIPARN